VLITGNGLSSTGLPVGSDGLVLTADSAQSTGLKYAQVDHANVLNKGTNTHAQIDAFIASKGQPLGLASLGPDGLVSAAQLPSGSGGTGYTPPTTKGVLITANGTSTQNLPVGTDKYVLTADSSAPLGLSYRQVDHANLLNKGTNTHAQLDAFVSSKGQASGLASLDSGGQVPLSQLGNVPSGVSLPTAKGVLITGDGSGSTTLPLSSTNNYVLTVDASQTTGLKYAQVDHTNLLNIGTNTHAQIDAFIASKSQANGIASLGADGLVPSTQLPPSSSWTPPTAKGAITVGNGAAAVTLSPGSNGQVLTVDSTAATGVAYKTPSGGGSSVGSILRTDAFSSGSGTVTAPAGSKTVYVTVCGAGGTGGWSTQTGSPALSGGGGGGGGAVMRFPLTISPGISVSYTVGASGGPGASTVTVGTWQIVGNNGADGGNNYDSTAAGHGGAGGSVNAPNRASALAGGAQVVGNGITGNKGLVDIYLYSGASGGSGDMNGGNGGSVGPYTGGSGGGGNGGGGGGASAFANGGDTTGIQPGTGAGGGAGQLNAGVDTAGAPGGPGLVTLEFTS
jgi:hypothetical protein